MPPVLEIILLVLGGISVLSGLVIVYMAPRIVERKKLDAVKQIDPERVIGLNEEGVAKFRKESAVLDVKVKGILVALPGAILILILCRI